MSGRLYCVPGALNISNHTKPSDASLNHPMVHMSLFARARDPSSMRSHVESKALVACEGDPKLTRHYTKEPQIARCEDVAVCMSR